MRFGTPAADGAAAPGKTVAVGAEVVAVSSEFGGDFAAANAVDGDPASEWSTGDDGDDASITLDLGRPVRVVELSLRSRSMSDGSSVVPSFTVTVDDGQTLGPFAAGTAFVVNPAEFTGRVLRFDASGPARAAPGAAEIEVYEAP